MQIETAFWSEFGELQSYLRQGMVELFADYGVVVERAQKGGEPGTDGASFAAIIGYAGQRLRGALVLLVPRDVALALLPLMGAPVDESSAYDMLGEFANMLLGRVKNRLLTRGVVLLSATPTTAIGGALRLPSPVNGTATWHEFRAPFGPLHVRFDATFDEGFALEPVSEQTTPPLAEGEMMMF